MIGWFSKSERFLLLGSGSGMVLEYLITMAPDCPNCMLTIYAGCMSVLSEPEVYLLHHEEKKKIIPGDEKIWG